MRTQDTPPPLSPHAPHTPRRTDWRPYQSYYPAFADFFVQGLTGQPRSGQITVPPQVLTADSGPARPPESTPPADGMAPSADAKPSPAKIIEPLPFPGSSVSAPACHSAGLGIGVKEEIDPFFAPALDQHKKGKAVRPAKPGPRARSEQPTFLTKLYG